MLNWIEKNAEFKTQGAVHQGVLDFCVNSLEFRN